MNTHSRFQPVLDKLAISTSAVCAIHCLFLPLMLGVFPPLGTTIFGEESFHTMLLWMVIPMSLVSLALGCRKHKSWPVALLGGTGIALLIAAALFGHDALGEDGERVLTLLGASAIALAHLRNFTLCRSADCDH